MIEVKSDYNAALARRDVDLAVDQAVQMEFYLSRRGIEACLSRLSLMVNENNFNFSRRSHEETVSRSSQRSC